MVLMVNDGKIFQLITEIHTIHISPVKIDSKNRNFNGAKFW